MSRSGWAVILVNTRMTKIGMIAKQVRKVAYWAIPVVVLTVILRRIDLGRLRDVLTHTNPFLLFLGFAFYPFAAIIGTLRWRVILACFLKKTPPFFFLLRHYYISFVIGTFSPASVGVDIYRIVAVGRKFGHFGLNTVAIVIEKITTLATILVWIILLYPFVRREVVATTSLLDSFMKVTLVTFAISVAAIVVSACLRQHRLSLLIRAGLGRLVHRAITRLRAFLRAQEKGKPADLPSFDTGAAPISVRSLAIVSSITIVAQILLAVKSQIFFHAMGHDLPLIVNVFLLPVFFLIFALPISFGSLGINEGTSILLYGLFGVPKEMALLVSFLNMSGILLNQAVGAILIWLGRHRHNAFKEPDMPSHL